jgi:hypothetical protein
MAGQHELRVFAALLQRVALRDTRTAGKRKRLNLKAESMLKS